MAKKPAKKAPTKAKKPTTSDKCHSLIEDFVRAFEAPYIPVITLITVGIRLWLAGIFWQSGINKLDNWETTLFLFEYEYAVPLLPVPIAAFLATAAEIIGSIMLVVGFGTRFAAAGLLIVTAVIEFTYQSHAQHMYWTIALAWLIVSGAGAFSWDYIIRGKKMGDAFVTTGAIANLVWPSVVALTLVMAYETAVSVGGMDAKAPSEVIREALTEPEDTTD